MDSIPVLKQVNASWKSSTEHRQKEKNKQVDLPTDFFCVPTHLFYYGGIVPVPGLKLLLYEVRLDPTKLSNSGRLRIWKTNKTKLTFLLFWLLSIYQL